MNKVTIEKVRYCDWDNCLEMRNARVRLIITTDVGPRVIHFSTIDGPNVFHQNSEQLGRCGDPEWHIYGGHRLWTSPQVGYRPNQPDNEPVQWEIIDGNCVRLIAQPERATQVQKQITVTLDPELPSVRVDHQIWNRGLWPIRLAPWALTVMREGGMEVFPLPREDTLFMPNYALSFWPWTNPKDHRFTLGEHYMFLKQDAADKRWFKIGYRNTEGWGAYFNNRQMFVKLYDEIPGKTYPDYGSTFETYTDADFIELESLGPLEEISTDQYVSHTEQWYLLDDVKAPSCEKDVEENILPLITRIKGKK